MSAPKKKEVVKEVIKKKIDGELTLRGCDALMVRMAMEKKPEVMSKAMLDLNRSVLPADFEPEKYSVSGKYIFEIEIREK